MPPAQDRWWIDEYRTAEGRSPIREFISGLMGRNKVEAIALIKLLEERGNTLRRPHSGSLGEGLFELRGHQVRIFYMFRPGRRLTLLDGIIKKQEKVPRQVLMRIWKMQKDVAAMDVSMERGS